MNVQGFFFVYGTDREHDEERPAGQPEQRAEVAGCSSGALAAPLLSPEDPD